MGAKATNSEPSLAGRARRKLHHLWWLWRISDLHRRNVEGLNGFHGVRSICFVCYGNICRSPAAASFARALRPGLTITSAGFHLTTGRISPDYIVDTCRTMGTDLTDHRSRLIDLELAKSSDLIVCMDHMNWQQFEKAFPEQAHKLVLLGPFGGEDATTIADPYAHPLPEVQATMNTIRDSVEGLMAQIPAVEIQCALAGQNAAEVSPPEPFLYITHDFPPARTSAVYRHIGLTKYLPNAGWRPIVISAQSAPGSVEDTSLLRNYPKEIDVIRTRSWKVDRLEKWLVSRARRSATASSPLRTPSPARDSSSADTQPSLFRKFARWGDRLYRSILYFPDETVGWIPFALAAGFKKVKKHRVKVIYTSSPPRSATFVGYLLKRTAKVRWVSEFRDPWYPPPGKFRAYLEATLLRHFLRQADAIILTAWGLEHDLIERFGLDRERVHVITNGFDEQEYPELSAEPATNSEHVQLSHFGTVYAGFAGRFFDALIELASENPGLTKQVRVNVIGFPDEITRSAASSPLIGSMIKIQPFMEQPRAIAAMKASDILLIFLGNRETSRLAISAKLFWYLRVGKPVLAIAYDGDCRSVILRSQSGLVAEPDSVDEIKRAITTLLDERVRNKIRPATEVVDEFRYDNLAVRLAQVLGKVAAG